MGLDSPFGRIARTRRALHRGDVALRRGDLVTADDRGRATIIRLGYDMDNPDLASVADLDLVASGLELVACVCRERADLIESVGLHEQALAALDAAPPTHHREAHRIAVLVRAGECHRLLGRYRQAEDRHRLAIKIASDLRPAEPLLLAASVNGLGIVYKDTQRFTEAARHYVQALVLSEKELGLDDPQLANLFHNLAGLNHAQDRFVEAEPHARRALSLRERGDGLASTGAAGDLAVLGAVLLGQRRYAEAEQALRHSLAIWQGRYGDQHYEVAVVQHNLAALYAARGQHQQARRAYHQVLEIKQRVLGFQHPDVVALQRHIDQLP
jgi:tetratricopeptide (TPR) repeat protein